MQIFYAPGVISDTYMLDEKESKHCIRVLRMTKGTPVKLIDGRGNLYEGVISIPDPGGCVIKINNVLSNFERRNYHLHIAISLLKNPERFEWFVEKSVEIGIDEITPLICTNTEKQGIKSERIKKLIISAMKQSIKTDITILNETCRFNDFLKKEFTGKKMIAHCNPGLTGNKIDKVYTAGNDAVILIGPEGDFSEDEIKAAYKVSYKAVHLGTSRLRTETAGIAACHSIYFLNQ
jgi:16S rRNA (uracil1498-N3)-methyltransferase